MSAALSPAAPAARPAAEVVAAPPAAEPYRRFRLFPTAWFAGIHIACFAAFFVGISWTAVAVCVGLYIVRMFAITAGYHRYFSHRAYDTSRPFAFLLGSVGATAFQKGPIWWASVHRLHHRASDGPEDAHSPLKRGFWWAHVGWILASTHSDTDEERVRDWMRLPEIRLLDRFHWVPPVLLGALLFFGGNALAAAYPSLHTSGAQLLVWGMAISTVLVYHGSWCVNSALHLWGKRRFATPDQSRNNGWVALFTFGEGWHNNHHRWPASERQGFYPGEHDFSHAVLKALSWVRLVWNLKTPPPEILEEGRRSAASAG